MDIDAMKTEDRISAAKRCVEKVVGHILHSIALHENNEVFIYSDVISSQIPESFAANAFNLTRDALFRYSLIRLCAVWDNDIREEAQTIPRIVKLISNRSVISALMKETCSHWPTHPFPVSDTVEGEALADSEGHSTWTFTDDFGRRQGAKAGWQLRTAVRKANTIIASQELQSIKNFRDKHIAHALSATKKEKAIGPIPVPARRAEIDLLKTTVDLAHTFYCWVNGTDFDFETSFEIRKGDAEALWKGCTVQPSV